jgi:hypothetical protein
MSLFDSLTSYGMAGYASASLAPPPSPVSDAQASRWHDDGSGLLGDALAFLGLRRAFKEGRATPDQSRSVVSHLIGTGKASLRSITGNLVAGTATLAAWYRDFLAAAFPRLYASSMALIGTGTLVPADRANLRVMAGQQLGYLDRFRRNLASAAQPLDGSAVSRAGLYASAAWSLAHNAYAASMIRDGHGEARWRLGAPEHHCGDCPAQAARGWVPADQLPDLGTLSCNQGCRCWKEFR